MEVRVPVQAREIRVLYDHGPSPHSRGPWHEDFVEPVVNRAALQLKILQDRGCSWGPLVAVMKIPARA